MNSRSLTALRAYVEDLGERGAFTQGTVRSYLTSIDTIFRDVPTAEASDVLSLDLDNLLAAFRKSALQQGFAQITIDSYESRVRAAIRRFSRHIEASKRPLGGTDSVTTAMPSNLAMENLCVPLRPGLTVEVKGLPFDVTPAEAKRIANVIVAMAELD